MEGSIRRKERIDRPIKARTDDLYALTSWREAAYLLAPRFLPLCLLAVLALAGTPYQRKVLVITAIYGLLAVSWDLLASTGLISLGQALFFGLGAYLAGAMNYYFHWPFWVTLPLASVGGGLLSALLLAPVLRLRGIYFAMVTLVLPLVLVRIIEATGILGGTEGFSGLDGLPGPAWETGLALFGFLLALAGFRRLMNSDFGLVFKAIRDDDRAVFSDGVNVYWIKTQALFLAGTAGAFAGAFFTHAYKYVGMPAFALDYSILPIAAAVVGGVGTLAGPALGAFLLVPFYYALMPLGSLRTVVYGLCLVIFVVVLPEGIFPFIRRKYHQLERWREMIHE